MEESISVLCEIKLWRDRELDTLSVLLLLLSVQLI